MKKNIKFDSILYMKIRTGKGALDQEEWALGQEGTPPRPLLFLTVWSESSLYPWSTSEG